jgi:glyoxylase-like metal-dependent hydrolase (beta-lactamase superfamily II)
VSIEGIHRFGDKFLNFYIIEEAGRLSIVDAGLPGHWRVLCEGLRRLGRELGDVEALLLTPSHLDHIGFAEPLNASAGVPTYVHRDDSDPGLRRIPPLSRRAASRAR